MYDYACTMFTFGSQRKVKFRGGLRNSIDDMSRVSDSLSRNVNSVRRCRIYA